MVDILNADKYVKCDRGVGGRYPSVNLEGSRVGRLSVLEHHYMRRVSSGKKASMYLTLCECGNKKYVQHSHLIRHSVQSCGCLLKDFLEHITCIKVGASIGLLTVLSKPSGARGYRDCRCHCGNMTKVDGCALKARRTTSCMQCKHVKDRLRRCVNLYWFNNEVHSVGSLSKLLGISRQLCNDKVQQRKTTMEIFGVNALHVSHNEAIKLKWPGLTDNPMALLQL